MKADAECSELRVAAAAMRKQIDAEVAHSTMSLEAAQTSHAYELGVVIERASLAEAQLRAVCAEPTPSEPLPLEKGQQLKEQREEEQEPEPLWLRDAAEMLESPFRPQQRSQRTHSAHRLASVEALEEELALVRARTAAVRPAAVRVAGATPTGRGSHADVIKGGRAPFPTPHTPTPTFPLDPYAHLYGHTPSPRAAAIATSKRCSSAENEAEDLIASLSFPPSERRHAAEEQAARCVKFTPCGDSKMPPSSGGGVLKSSYAASREMASKGADATMKTPAHPTKATHPAFAFTR